MKEKFNVNEVFEEIISNLDEDSYRMRLIKTSREFKLNWVEFGEHLTKVATDKLYEEWGYNSFEDYCRIEVKIKKNTAIKLTNAYFFMSQEEPEYLQKAANVATVSDVPDLEAINVLQKAKDDENCTPEAYQALKNSALVEGKNGTTLARKYKELTKVEENKTDKFKEQSLVLVKRLKKKISTLEDIPGEFESYLGEIEQFFTEDTD